MATLFYDLLAAAFYAFLPGSVHPQSQEISPAQMQKPSDSPVKATFLTPPNSQIVHPGEIVHFDVSVGPGQSEGPVTLVSPLGTSKEIRNSPPYSFTLEIPQAVGHVTGGLIGIHPVTAFGKVPGKDQWGLAAIDVDVEESEMPTKLSANYAGSQYGRPGLKFFNAGEEESIRIVGTFPNGDILDVNNSTYLTVTSEDPKVVSVAEAGRLTSVGPGTTTLTATYTVGEQTVQAKVPVSVTVPTTGLIPSPRSVDFGDVKVGTVSTQKVTLTNHSDGPIKIYDFEIWQPVRDADNCTSAPLPPDGTCTFSVVFAPVRRGRTQMVIYINNDFSHLALPVLGNGI